MESYSIVDPTPPQGTEPGATGPGTELEMTEMGANRSTQGSVSAVLAEANGLSTTSAFAPRFPGDAGHSLVEMAQRDLDAALQLLAERAQYITGASGVAIALRRGGYNDMLCRASTGPNAPELGALLSAEFGLSGESVRTRLPLRCDDTESDARVNREGCRQLGVSSVAVMPIVSDEQVLGVFELFSGSVNAFGERDLSTLQRLSEMVEAAVRLAQATQRFPTEVMGEFVDEVSNLPAVEVEPAAPVAPVEEPPAPTAAAALTPALPESAVVDSASSTPVKKPLLWTAASQLETQEPESDQSYVPPVLRNLHKCQACGFPVSEGRKLCVECEEKQWRGQSRGAPAMPKTTATAASTGVTAVSKPVAAKEAKLSTPIDKPVLERITSASPIKPTPMVVGTSALAPAPLTLGKESPTLSALPAVNEASTLPFWAGISSSESWLSANKYVLGTIALLLVAVGVIALLR
jgi:hypothetical protein